MKKILSILLMFQLSIGNFFISVANATLSSPTWYDSNAVSVNPDWHYRVPIIIPTGAAINSTITVDVDFNTLLNQMGVSGTFDVNSPRVVRSSGVLATTQEFNNNIYANATNATLTRGEVRFLLEDSGPITYYLYFDITQNGVKPTNTQAVINGRFEQGGSNGLVNPPGWNAPTKTNANFDAQLRTSESPSISTDGGVVGNGASPRTVDGTPNTGAYSYLIGARTNIEAVNGFPTITFTKTIVVPSSNPGNLTFKYRIQGWDSNVNGNTTTYDYLSASIVGTSTTNMVGPAANNYTTYPFSPNYGTQSATTNGRSGYGQYNGFDFNASGTRVPKGGNVAMTVGYGAEPWWTVTQSLAAFAGQTVTLRFTFNNTTLYKSWAHIDDVEWSVINATLGMPEGFGAEVNSPNGNLIAGTTLSITAQVNALAVNPKAYVYKNGTLVAGPINLYNDGTRGSNSSTPNIWTNNGSDNANPTYTIPLITNNSNWSVIVYANDNSTTTIGGVSGLIKKPTGSNTPINETNFYNVGENAFQVIGINNYTNIKTVSIIKDPINNTTNPKAIPGAEVLYNILITSTSGGVSDNNTMFITDKIPTNTIMYVKDLGVVGSGPISFTQGTITSGLTYNYVALNNTTDNLFFSNDNGVTWTYIPTPDANGYDANVTDIKVSFNGIMNFSDGTNNPSFNVGFKVKIQ